MAQLWDLGVSDVRYSIWPLLQIDSRLEATANLTVERSRRCSNRFRLLRTHQWRHRKVPEGVVEIWRLTEVLTPASHTNTTATGTLGNVNCSFLSRNILCLVLHSFYLICDQSFWTIFLFRQLKRYGFRFRISFDHFWNNFQFWGCWGLRENRLNWIELKTNKP